MKGTQEARDRMAKARSARKKGKVSTFGEFQAVTVFRMAGNLFVMRKVKVKDGKVVEIIDSDGDMQAVVISRALTMLEDLAS